MLCLQKVIAARFECCSGLTALSIQHDALTAGWHLWAAMGRVQPDRVVGQEVWSSSNGDEYPQLCSAGWRATLMEGNSAVSIAPSRQQAPAHPLLGAQIRLCICSSAQCIPQLVLCLPAARSTPIQHCLCTLPSCNLLLSIMSSVWGKQCCAAADG